MTQSPSQSYQTFFRIISYLLGLNAFSNFVFRCLKLVLFPYTTISLLTVTQKCGKCLFYRPQSVVQIASSYVNNKPHRFLQNALLNSRQFLSLASHCEYHRVQLCVYLQNYDLRWVFSTRLVFQHCSY